MGMATTSGAMPGESIAGSVKLSVLRGDLDQIALSECPIAAAVLGLISIQLDHIAVVSTSGISCSHGRCASEPSRNAWEA